MMGNLHGPRGGSGVDFGLFRIFRTMKTKGRVKSVDKEDSSSVSVRKRRIWVFSNFLSGNLLIYIALKGDKFRSSNLSSYRWNFLAF